MWMPNAMDLLAGRPTDLTGRDELRQTAQVKRQPRPGPSIVSRLTRIGGRLMAFFL